MPVTSVFQNNDIWLSEDLYEIAGLAQHYGLPTRLLDWSQDIYVSLYFACIGAMNSIKNNGFTDDNIVLWASFILYAQQIRLSCCPCLSWLPGSFSKNIGRFAI